MEKIKVEYNKLNEKIIYDKLNLNSKKKFTRYKNIYIKNGGEKDFFNFLSEIKNNKKKKRKFLKNKGITKEGLDNLINDIEKIMNKVQFLKDIINSNLEFNLIFFDKIYENFNIDNVFENKPIENFLKLSKINDENILIFKDFCDFLIKKIKNAKTKKEVKKIPYIISNLSNFKIKGYNQTIKNKRNEVMEKYNKKFKPKRRELHI